MSGLFDSVSYYSAAYDIQNAQSQRILWLLEELEIPYNLKLHTRVDLRAPPEMKKTHPLGKAPQLETGNGRVIVESVSIARYLIETYDKASKFKGDGGKNDWIRDDQLCELAAASIGPVLVFETIMTFAVRFSPFFIRWLMAGIHKNLASAFSGPELAAYFKYMDEQLGDQDYFMGTSPGTADFIISHPVHSCIAGGMIELNNYPRLEKWHARCQERPAWKRALEKSNGYDMAFKDPDTKFK